MAKSTASEKRKKIILATLGGLFAVVLVYQLFFGGPAPKKPRSANANSAVATTDPSTAGKTPQKGKSQPSSNEQDQLMAIALADLTPLDLSALHPASGSTSSGERGPIFAYWVKPPDPPAPLPPPPPIGLQSVNPGSAVAGTTRDITLTVTGTKIPEDAQVYINGVPRATKHVSSTQLSVEVKANEYTAPSNWNIEVKSQSDPVNNNSNTIQFMVQQAPDPGFRYIGRLGEFGVFELSNTKEIKRLRRGDPIQTFWRIDSIADTGVEVTHTQYGIKRRVPMVDKSK